MSFKVIHMTRMGRSDWLITSRIINKFEKYLGCKLWGCLEQFCIELVLSGDWAFLFLWDLIIKMISSLSGGAVLTLRSCSASWTSASAVGGSLFRTSLKCSAQGLSISVSDVTNRPFLSLTGTSVGLWYLLQTTLVILYTFPCSPLLAASSAWLARSSMSTRLSALANLFTFLSDSWYCSLCLSFSLSDLASLNCFFKSLLVLTGFHSIFLYLSRGWWPPPHGVGCHLFLSRALYLLYWLLYEPSRPRPSTLTNS